MAARDNQSNESSSNQGESKFAKHTQSDDSALAPDSGDAEVQERKVLSWSARIAIFMIFPLIVGSLSMLVGLIEKRKNPEYELDVDRDFMFPFMLALCLTLVIGFQTRGYTKHKPDSLVAWPKVKKQTKVVHRHVVKGQDENGAESDKKND